MTEWAVLEGSLVDLEIEDCCSGHVGIFAARESIRSLALRLHNTLGSAARADDVRVQYLHIFFMLKRAAAKGSRQGLFLSGRSS